jgi:hypothetical protein
MLLDKTVGYMFRFWVSLNGLLGVVNHSGQEEVKKRLLVIGKGAVSGACKISFTSSASLPDRGLLRSKVARTIRRKTPSSIPSRSLRPRTVNLRHAIDEEVKSNSK